MNTFVTIQQELDRCIESLLQSKPPTQQISKIEEKSTPTVVQPVTLVQEPAQTVDDFLSHQEEKIIDLDEGAPNDDNEPIIATEPIQPVQQPIIESIVEEPIVTAPIATPKKKKSKKKKNQSVEDDSFSDTLTPRTFDD